VHSLRLPPHSIVLAREILDGPQALCADHAAFSGQLNQYRVWPGLPDMPCGGRCRHRGTRCVLVIVMPAIIPCHIFWSSLSIVLYCRLIVMYRVVFAVIATGNLRTVISSKGSKAGIHGGGDDVGADSL
jgi:hypothetical protein